MSQKSSKANHHLYVNQSEIESDSKKFTYHPDIDSDEDVDDFADDQVHKELGDDVVEFSTFIFPLLKSFLKMLHTITLVKYL